MRQGPMTKAEEVARAVREEAERGDVDAQAAMGVMYLIGRGVEQDLEEAVAWLRRAAEQDNPDAQHNLGVAYDTGFYGMLPSDAVEAMAWYRLAANQGHAGSQYNLGVAYAEGNGVPQHDVQAIKWWRKAAERGYARAQYNLGVRYSRGEGVARDDVQAVEWWDKAAQSPDIATKPQRDWLSPEGNVVKRASATQGVGSTATPMRSTTWAACTRWVGEHLATVGEPLIGFGERLHRDIAMLGPSLQKKCGGGSYCWSELQLS